MARGFAKRLNASLAIIDKRRPSANVAEVVNVVGEVADKDCLIPDDMIDTAGTVTEAAAALKRLGPRNIYAFASPPPFSRPAGGAPPPLRPHPSARSHTAPLTRTPD